MLALFGQWKFLGINLLACIYEGSKWSVCRNNFMQMTADKCESE